MASYICYFVFLLHTVSPCHILQLASYLYLPPEITSPKENGIISRKEIRFAWTATSPKFDVYGLLTMLNFLYDFSYHLQIRRRGEGKTSVEYKTKNLFIVLPEKDFPAGPYQARIASVCIFGNREWSKVRKFDIVDAESVQAESIDENGSPAIDPQLSTNPSKDSDGKESTQKPDKPVFVPIATVTPQILIPRAGAKVEIGKLSVQWTQVLGASRYLLRVTEESSGECKDFQLKNRFCDNCEVTNFTLGTHTAKVAAILKDRFGDWGPEIQFEIIDHLKPPKMKQVNRDIYNDNGDREFEWSKVDGAEMYELYITNSEQSIRVETPYTFYNMWHFTMAERHKVKVAACDSFSTSDWSEESSFPIYNIGKIGSVFSRRVPAVHMFTFQPVSKDWMVRMCKLHLSDLCDMTRINRDKMEPIAKPNLIMPANRGNVYGSLGNTFFAALSHAISNSSDHHLMVRNLTIQELVRNQPYYLKEEMPLAEYFQRQNTRANNVPPTDIEIVCAANLLQTAIWIFESSRSPSCWIDYQPRITNHLEAIYLYRQGSSSHYPYKILYTWN